MKLSTRLTLAAVVGALALSAATFPTETRARQEERQRVATRPTPNASPKQQKEAAKKADSASGPSFGRETSGKNSPRAASETAAHVPA